MAKRKPLKDCIVKPGEQFVDTYNYTVVELPKVPFFIDKKSDDLSKWLFFFRFLSRLRELPAEFSEHKFEHLTESSKVSNFSKEEFEVYQKMYHEKWDHNVMVDGIFEEFADEINAKVAEGVSESKREMAKAMLADNVPVEKIAAYSGLSVEEIARL